MSVPWEMGDDGGAMMDGVSRRVSSTRLVGRTAELAIGADSVDRLRAAASDDSARVLLISGEAGIGKSRLLEELLGLARDAGAVTTCGRCLEHGGEVRPLTAVAQILGELRSMQDDSEPTAVSGELQPNVADSPSEALAHLFDRVRSSLRAVSQRSPVVVAVEDVHWSDRTTRGLLSELVRTRDLQQVLLVLTYRSDELHRRHPLMPLLADFERVTRPERIELAPLTAEELVDMAASILGRPVGADEADDLRKRTGGNPFYAEELLAAAESERLPDGLRHVILARSQRLEADAMACVQAAAVLAQPIDSIVLGATTGLGVEAHRAAVDAVCREHFLVEDETGFRFRHELVREVFLDELLPGERSDLFSRAAESLERHRPERVGEIAHLHMNAAQLPEALQASVRAGDAAAAIGASAEASQHYGRAIDLWERVGDPTHWAGITRLRLLRRAAEVADLARDFDLAVELAKRAADEAEAAADHFEHGAALFELSGYLWNASTPGMESAIERALAVLPDAPPTLERARLEIRAAMNLLFAGEREPADRALATAAAKAAELGERGLESTARAHIGLWRAQLGDERAVRRLRDGFEIATEIDDGPNGTVMAINLTHTLLALGRYREVADLHTRGAALAERHGFAATRGVVFEGNVMLALEALGEWDRAATIMGQIRRRLDPDTIHRWASAFLGWTQIEINRGHHTDVAASYRRGLAMWETGYYDGDQLPVGTGLIELSAVGLIEPIDAATIDSWLGHLRPGHSPLAARLVATAARHLVPPAGDVDHARIVETVLGWIGRLRATTSEYFDAPPILDTWLAQAEAELSEGTGRATPDRWADLVARWDRLGCPYFAADARHRHADAVLRTGGGRSATERTAATRLLADAHGTALDLDAEPLRRNIEDLARRARLTLSARDPAPSEPAPFPAPFGLTTREQQVLELVNDGRSNGDIGDSLFISTKTASVHVSNILRKLGAANRIEAAAIARRHHLVERTPRPK